jgi:hypothetical protein
MALRIDHLNKKLAALGVILVRSEEGGFEFQLLGDADICRDVQDVEKINDLTEAQWMEEAQAFIDEGLEVDEPEDGEEDGKMSGTLKKYRPLYVKATSYSGNHSLDNGDEVAALMRGMSPQEACALADKAFGEPEFHHWEKWQHLNPGSRRMNAGNRIRAAYRREDFTLDDLKAWVAGKDIVDDEAEV